VDPRGGLDGCGKSRPPPGFDPRTVHPVASRYTDCAISSLSNTEVYRDSLHVIGKSMPSAVLCEVP
jgi:hypothetical protein